VNVEVVLTKAAKTDVLEAAKWYQEQSALAVERFLNEVAAAMRRLSIQPMAQPIVDAPTGARRILVRRFPYRLLYLLDEGRAIVLAVVHSRRDESFWRERLK
jgi:plasmid stabilization system protein ParE